MLNDQMIYILRIILAGICGIAIGMERKNRSKEAGIRTHFVVACGAALIMIVSKYAFFDLIQGGAFGDVEVRLDPSRVASTIASGIGFLGAGMIFVHKNTISGLTTAAGIWATSGVGMAIGAGMYVVGIGAAIVILIAQLLLHLELHRNKNANIKVLLIKEVDIQNFQSIISDKFEEKKVSIQSVSIDCTNDNKTKDYTLKIDIPSSITEEEVLNMIDYKCSIKSVQ